jgi:hypothetical protein
LREVGSQPEASGGIETSTLAKYVGGQSMSEEEFLRAGKAGSLTRCVQQHLIGLVRLSQGDRVGAGQHFQQSVDTMWYYYSLYQYSRVFRARLEHDKTWPQWIEAKK